MEIREEYRPKIVREPTAHELNLWSFKPDGEFPDVLDIREPRTDTLLYSHSQIDEEAEGFYKASDANYFTKRFRKQVEREQTWSTFLTAEGVVNVRPLERQQFWAARELVKNYFISRDPLWSYYKFEKDEASYKEILRIVKEWITSNQSVMAINPKSKTLHGVALGCYNDGTYLSKKIAQVQVFDDKVSLLMNVRRFFQKRVTSALKFWNKSFYEIHLMCVDDLFPVKLVPGLLRGLVGGCEAMARQLNAEWILGLSSQPALTTALSHSGFQLFAACPLYSWLSRHDHLSPDFRSLIQSDVLSVFVKELAPDPDLKWLYYRKMDQQQQPLNTE